MGSGESSKAGRIERKKRGEREGRKGAGNGIDEGREGGREEMEKRGRE